MTKTKIPTIGTGEHFYGYLTGLGVGGTLEDSWEHDLNLYAMFEYNGARSVWIVPDSELFEILSKHLCSMAWYRKNASDDFGYNKLWIEFKDGKWIVELP
jgi:hypothetical protein